MKNTKYDIETIKDVLEDELDAKRYEHTLGVAYTAAALAMRYECSVEKAFIAGLLHDCAKCMKKKEKEEYCQKKKIVLSDTETKIPALQHAKIGSYLCETKYGVTDMEIKSAILYHTTGHPDMSLLEKIVFIADYIEPNREPLPNIDVIRKTTFEDLDSGLKMILKDTLQYLNECGKTIDPMTQITYDFYLNN